MLVPINITGPTAQSRSKALSNQQTINLYPERGLGKSEFVLNSFPGNKAFSTDTSACRGAFVHQNVFYHVTGTSLYTVSTAGVKTSVGTIPGSDRCIFDGINSNIVIVTGGNVYVYDGSTVTQVTDSDLESPNSCTHLNSQIIYDGDGGRWCSSDVGDATSINGLNYATAESKADDIIRVRAFKQILYLFGEQTIEPWWNSGIGEPPFDRIEAIIPVGLGALHSVSGNDNFLYFLGDDRNIYYLQGTDAQRISTIEIANQLETFTKVDDAQGHTFTLQGQNFYAITFPSQNKTFCFNESIGAEYGWFELRTGENRFLHSAHVFFNGKNYVTDYRNGNIYELDKDTFDDDGDEIIRIRDSGPLHGGLLQAPGKRLTMNSLELLCEVGVGSGTGQGLNPVVMMSYSDDGGRTFSTERPERLGKAGEFLHRVRWFGLGSFYSRILRFRFSDPVYICIHSCAADIEIGI